MRKKGIPVMNVGISLIILVFISLCLLTFSVLSLENAVADRRLSQRAASHTKDYYEAVNQVQIHLQETQYTLEKLWKEDGESHAGGETFQLYKEDVLKTFGKDAWEKTADGEVQLVYREPVSDQQSLCVKVELIQPENGIYYNIVYWRLEVTGQWEADNSLDVYQGNSGKETDNK